MSVERTATKLQFQETDGLMDFSSAFSPIHVGYSMKKSPPPPPPPPPQDFTVAQDTRPSMLHSTVTTFVPHPVSMSSYLPPDVAMYHWSSQRDAFLSHKLLAYYPGFAAHGSPYNCTEDEKPSQSYIGLIGKAILSSPQKKLVLSDIYNFILAHHSYFRNKGPGWRNSIRHNLSLNECFIKVGRSPNGKGHFWAINPVNYEDFSKGEYRRKRVQRRNRKTTDLAHPCTASRKSAATNEPTLKREELARARKAAINPCGVERPIQRGTINRGFHIETLLSDCKPKRPSKRSAFSCVVPTTDPERHFPTSQVNGMELFAGNTLVSSVKRGSQLYPPLHGWKAD